MADYIKEGRESEWNEAAFKSKRLHDIQENINLLKIDPTNIIGSKFVYDLLLKEIGCLYREGRSKYSAKEKEEVDKIESDCKKTIELNPPHRRKVNVSFNRVKEVKYILNKKNYDTVMDLLEYFENKVKDYNDAHGLTTKNRKSGGLF